MCEKWEGNQRVMELKGERRKPRFLCLHGFRTSGEILRKQVTKWPEKVLNKIDLVFLDGPFPASGKSEVEGIFDPPYYEWFQHNSLRFLFSYFTNYGGFTVYRNLEECFKYIEEGIIKHGPIDGLLGFSQGAVLSAALPGLQAKGIALTKVAKIKYLIIIAGARLQNVNLAKKAFETPVQIPSIHFLGKKDYLRRSGIQLLKSFVDPFVINHPKGHTVPRLDDKSVPIMLSFLEKIEKDREVKVQTTSKEIIVTKQNNTADWKELQIYLIFLAFFLALAVALYTFFENSDMFWNIQLGRDQPARPIFGAVFGDHKTDDQSKWGEF